jgi:hypothetical protein
MKCVFFISALCFFCGNFPVFAEDIPYVHFSPEVASLLFGNKNPSNPKGVLDCRVLVAHSWPYPNSQVTPICTDAEIACLRYGLLSKSLKEAKGAKLERLKKDFAMSHSDVYLRLRGCQLAIEATISQTASLVEAAGFYPASVEEYRP